MKYLWISKTSLISISKRSLVSVELKSTEKKFTTPFNHAFFILLIVKSFEVLPKLSVYFFYLESFVLN